MKLNYRGIQVTRPVSETKDIIFRHQLQRNNFKARGSPPLCLIYMWNVTVTNLIPGLHMGLLHSCHSLPTMLDASGGWTLLQNTFNISPLEGKEGEKKVYGMWKKVLHFSCSHICLSRGNMDILGLPKGGLEAEVPLLFMVWFRGMMFPSGWNTKFQPFLTWSKKVNLVSQLTRATTP